MTPRLRPNEHASRTSWLLPSAGAVALSMCLLGVGCASSPKERTLRQADSRLTILSDSADPLRHQFNADKDRLRALALLSPT